MIGRRAKIVLGAMLIVFGTTGPVAGSEDSERFTARGLVDFHAGRHDMAADWFERATQADSDDAHAHFYEGLNHARRLDFVAAERALQEAAKDPAIARAPFELGYALMKLERYSAAIPFLAKASGEQSTRAEAALLLGLAQIRAGRPDDAADALQTARDDPTHRRTAVYLEGIAAFDAENWNVARERFESVIAEADDGLAEAARGFLANIPDDSAEKVVFHANLALQYDSNVTAAPTDDLVKTVQSPGDQTDLRTTIEVGARAVVASGETWTLDAGYNFFQSLHFDFSEFDIQNHRPSLSLGFEQGAWRYGGVVKYDYFLGDGDELLSQVSMQPWLSRAHGSSGRTDAYVSWRRREFLQDGAGALEGAQYAAGVRQFFYLGSTEDYAVVGYRFNVDDLGAGSTRPFAFRAHQAEVGLGWMLPGGVESEASYSYQFEDYDSDADGREDQEHRFAVAFRRRITTHLSVVAEYIGHVNVSNDARFDYDRHVASFALEVR